MAIKRLHIKWLWSNRTALAVVSQFKKLLTTTKGQNIQRKFLEWKSISKDKIILCCRDADRMREKQKASEDKK